MGDSLEIKEGPSYPYKTGCTTSELIRNKLRAGDQMFMRHGFAKGSNHCRAVRVETAHVEVERWKTIFF